MFDPSGHGVLSWTEIGTLLRVMGLPEVISDRLLDAISLEKRPNNSVGLDFAEWTHLVESEQFRLAVVGYETVNQAELTLTALTVALRLLSASKLTMDQIRSLRMAVEYQESGTAGISSDPDSLAAALQMSNRTIGRERLVRWLRDRGPTVVPGRLQLFELFELFRSSKDSDFIREIDDLRRVHKPEETSRRGDGTFELVGDDAFLTPRERHEKVAQQQYVMEEAHTAARRSAELATAARREHGADVATDADALWRMPLKTKGKKRPQSANPALGRHPRHVVAGQAEDVDSDDEMMNWDSDRAWLSARYSGGWGSGVRPSTSTSRHRAPTDRLMPFAKQAAEFIPPRVPRLPLPTVDDIRNKLEMAGRSRLGSQTVNTEAIVPQSVSGCVVAPKSGIVVKRLAPTPTEKRRKRPQTAPVGGRKKAEKPVLSEDLGLITSRAQLTPRPTSTPRRRKRPQSAIPQFGRPPPPKPIISIPSPSRTRTSRPRTAPIKRSPVPRDADMPAFWQNGMFVLGTSFSR